MSIMVKDKQYFIFILFIFIIVEVNLLNTTKASIMKRVGENVTLNCSADGLPQPVITWKKNGNLLVNSTRITITSKQEYIDASYELFQNVWRVTSLLSIRDIKESDTGNYTCKANNEDNIGASATQKLFQLKTLKSQLRIIIMSFIFCVLYL